MNKLITSNSLPALFLITSALTATWMFPVQAAEPVATVQDWPMWSGPTSNWLASPDEKSLIADLNQAKLLWTSEDKACGGVRGQSRRYGGRVGMKPSAGGASPIVYRDKVYFYFLEPKGAVSSNISYNHDPRVMAEQFLADPELVSQGFNKEQFLDLWRIEANDVVLCMDADTGKTLWRKVFPDGLYHDDWAKPRNANNTPAAGAGKIFFYSSMGVLRALDAESGELVWEAWNSEEKQAQRQAVIDRGHLQEKRAPKAIMGPPVLFADGLAIFTHAVSKNNYGREKSLVAFDGTSGEQKWRVDEVGPGQGAPSLWFHDKVSYIVAASQLGNVTCVRVADGKVMWKLTGKAYNGHSITVAGDYMVINEVGEAKKYKSAQLGAYKLTPEKAQHLWTLPPELHNSNATSPRIIYKDRVYVRRADVKPLPESILVLDLQTGKLLAETEVDHDINGCQIIADDKIYYELDGNHNSVSLINSYSADPADFRRLSQWTMPNGPTNAYEIPMARPIVKGKMYARHNDGHIRCYDVTAPQSDTKN